MITHIAAVKYAGEVVYRKSFDESELEKTPENIEKFKQSVKKLTHAAATHFQHHYQTPLIIPRGIVGAGREMYPFLEMQIEHAPENVEYSPAFRMIAWMFDEVGIFEEADDPQNENYQESKKLCDAFAWITLMSKVIKGETLIPSIMH